MFGEPQHHQSNHGIIVVCLLYLHLIISQDTHEMFGHSSQNAQLNADSTVGLESPDWKVHKS